MATLGGLLGGGNGGGDGSQAGNYDDANALSDLANDAAQAMPMNRNGGGIGTGWQQVAQPDSRQTANQNATMQAPNVTFGKMANPNPPEGGGQGGPMSFASPPTAATVPENLPPPPMLVQNTQASPQPPQQQQTKQSPRLLMAAMIEAGVGTSEKVPCPIITDNAP